MSQTTTERFNLLTPDALTNPYPLLKEIRREAPVYWSEQIQSWVVTRYRDVQALMFDPRCSAERIGALTYMLTDEQREELKQLHNSMGRWIVFRDPPYQSRVRALIVGALTPRVIARMRPRIEELANELLDEVADKGKMDLMRDFAQPFTTSVIAEMLGANPKDRQQFMMWKDGIEPLSNNRTDYDAQRQVLHGILSMEEYFRRLLKEEPERMKDTLLGGLLDMKIEDDQLNLEDALACAVLFMFAGQTTTTDLIGLSIWNLLQHPDVLAQLRADYSRIPQAIEELMRYDGPMISTNRFAREPIQIDDVTIQPGQSIMLYIAAANHDPEQFPNPDHLDINRHDPRHLTLGYGTHFCIGHAVGRLEAQVAVETLLRRLPNLRLGSTPPDWKMFLLVRGLFSLPLEFDPAV